MWILKHFIRDLSHFDVKPLIP